MTSSIVTGLVVGALVTGFQGFITRRTNTAISKLDHKLDQQNSSIKSHIDQFLSANQIFHQIKIDAYKEVWDKLAEFKHALPVFIICLDLYKKSEYENLTKLLKDFASLLLKPENSFSKTEAAFRLTLEKQKPYLGKAYILFYAYSFFLSRLSLQTVINFDKEQKIIHWEDDALLNQIINHRGVLTEEESNSVISKEFNQIQHIQFLFEQKIFKSFDEICIGLSLLPLTPEQNDLITNMKKEEITVIK